MILQIIKTTDGKNEGQSFVIPIDEPTHQQWLYLALLFSDGAFDIETVTREGDRITLQNSNYVCVLEVS